MQSEPAFEHGVPAKAGVLLVNLGTPDAPTAPALRRYLRQFLWDPRLVEMPRPLWWLILHLLVLPRRPRQSAHRYAKIWTADGSPLKLHTERQAKLLRGFLGDRIKGLVVDYAMRYGSPSVAEGLARLRAQHCDRILVLPLYPQYAASTTASMMDAVGAAFRDMRNQPALRSVRHFHDDAGYIKALANSISEYWSRQGRPDQLVMSFHGLPRFTLDRGDPYHCECHKTARLLAEALGLAPKDYRIAFQSRFGAAKWLSPYTSDVLKELGTKRLARVDVVCPGFVADCLETLEEIAIEGKGIFLTAGGGEYRYIPCLNERDDWMRALANIAARNLQGWMENASTPDELARSRERALAAGART
jgi:ferrochelatase